MSRKRKIEAVGANIASAALSDVVSRGIGAMVGKLEEHRHGPDDVNGEEEVERLDTLVTTVRAAVEAAEGVHIRNWWLRRWLWKLRDAACEGAAAVRSFRQRAAEERHSGSGGARKEGPWWARLLRSAATRLLFFSRDGGGGAAAQLRRELRRLEELSASIGDFLKLLERETGAASPPVPPPSPAPSDGSEAAVPMAFRGWMMFCDGRWSGFDEISEPQESPPPSPAAHSEILCDEFSAAHMDDGDHGEPCRRDGTISESGGRKSGVDLDWCVSGVIGFAVGATLIWFAFQRGNRVVRRSRAR